MIELYVSDLGGDFVESSGTFQERGHGATLIDIRSALGYRAQKQFPPMCARNRQSCCPLRGVRSGNLRCVETPAYRSHTQCTHRRPSIRSNHPHPCT
jgi:hypothetical protein